MESPEHRRGTGQAHSSPHSSHSLQERQKGARMPTLDNVILGHRVKGKIGKNCGTGRGFPRDRIPTARRRQLSAIVRSFINLNPIRKHSRLSSKDAGAAAGSYLVSHRVC